MLPDVSVGAKSGKLIKQMLDGWIQSALLNVRLIQKTIAGGS